MFLASLFKRRSFILFCLSLVTTMIFSTISSTALSSVKPAIVAQSVQSRYQSQNTDEQAAADAFMSYVRSKSSVSTLAIAKVGVVQNFALIYWSLPVDDSGGNALLFLENGIWKVKTSGAGALGFIGLESYGVPDGVAETLLDQLDPTWRNPQSDEP